MRVGRGEQEWDVPEEQADKEVGGGGKAIAIKDGAVSWGSLFLVLWLWSANPWGREGEVGGGNAEVSGGWGGYVEGTEWRRARRCRGGGGEKYYGVTEQHRENMPFSCPPPPISGDLPVETLKAERPHPALAHAGSGNTLSRSGLDKTLPLKEHNEEALECKQKGIYALSFRARAREATSVNHVRLARHPTSSEECVLFSDIGQVNPNPERKNTKEARHLSVEQGPFWASERSGLLTSIPKRTETPRAPFGSRSISSRRKEQKETLADEPGVQKVAMRVTGSPRTQPGALHPTK
ncbi:hypothetical protein BDK51DRAFT_27842 [Blyttiomyces helicus]|uniref:Uncharacterized protein n=1 Tax=Blyttiomyces helicus TaxID=388810 RepID=A0A4P9W9Q2_9FUNG|nr:hypothetical protein BDK51DRAFT_27842 [Blyttiomyces helicus]|eukprot:RKO89291.1 hypothetical protein BDK51DRAFT_27842 [Blyttiomyces helicus]